MKFVLKMTLLESVLRGGVLGAVVGAYLARNCATQRRRRRNGRVGNGVRREMEDGGRTLGEKHPRVLGIGDTRLMEGKPWEKCP